MLAGARLGGGGVVLVWVCSNPTQTSHPSAIPALCPMVAINTRGIVLYCNEATTQLFRWERAELAGKNVKVLPRRAEFFV